MSELTPATVVVLIRDLRALIALSGPDRRLREERYRALTELVAIARSSPERTELGPDAVELRRYEVDTATAAKRLGITPRAVQKQCAAGELPARRVGRTWLIDWRGAP